MSGPWRVFISYARADEALRARLRIHLASLEDDGLIKVWDDRSILPGEKWEEKIGANIDRANLILLLISPHFIASKECKKEMTRALARRDAPNNHAFVVPIILRDCDWKTKELQERQALPRDGRPLFESESEDASFTEVTLGLRALIQETGSCAHPPIIRPQRSKATAAFAVGTTLIAIATGAWFIRSGEETDAINQALTELRIGRGSSAVEVVEPLCARRLASSDACFVFDKAQLAASLENPAETIDLEDFRSKLHALEKRSQADPDVLFYAGSLATMDLDPATRARSMIEGEQKIRRALDEAGEYPEACFALANFELMRNRNEEARTLLDRAVTSGRAAPHYLNARAEARARLRDYSGATADYLASADAGLILSRIELAPLLWGTGDLAAAKHQLETARAALTVESGARRGRNVLPWIFRTVTNGSLVIKTIDEKRCYANLLFDITKALKDGSALDTLPICGPYASFMPGAAAAMLTRALDAGAKEPEASRARELRARLVAGEYSTRQ